MQPNFYEINGINGINEINGINQINEIQELQEIDERMMRNVASFVEPVEEIPSAESMEQRLYNLMAERQEYANELYDTLSIREAVPQYSVSILFLDTSQNELEFEEEMENEMFFENEGSSFWDPVVVHLTSQQIENIQTVNLNQECSICNVEKDSFKKVQCCNNVLCVECCTSWFLTSVYCTFCRGDLREHLTFNSL